MEERWLKGLYFNCDELFTLSHKWKELFLIGSIDDGEEFAGKERNSSTSHILLEDKCNLKEGSNVRTLLVCYQFTHGNFKEIRK